jgi:hypothetical protein
MKEAMLGASRLQIRQLVAPLPAFVTVALGANAARSFTIKRVFSSKVIRVFKICD